MTTDSDYSVAILAYTAVELHTNAGCGLHLDGDLSFGLEPFGNLLDPFSTVGTRLMAGNSISCRLIVKIPNGFGGSPSIGPPDQFLWNWTP